LAKALSGKGILGLSGRTFARKGAFLYWNEAPQFQEFKDFAPEYPDHHARQPTTRNRKLKICLGFFS